MANGTLFTSSVVMAVAHGLAILAWGDDAWLVFVYVVGVATSLLNHGLHEDAPSALHHLRLIDRVWMVLGTATDVWYICHLPAARAVAAAALVAAYVGAFFAAKALVARSGSLSAGNAPHLCTHAGACVLHAWLLYETSPRGGGVAVRLPAGLSLLLPPAAAAGAKAVAVQLRQNATAF